MLSEYKLRCAIYGHENDVRALTPLNFPPDSFVSGSRDVTSRVWVLKEDEPGYREGIVLGGHSGYVSAVCVLPPDSDYPHGLIITGSNDHNIHAYTLDSPEPVYRLSGHTNNVCSLYAGKFGTLISGSWDTTARVWLKQKSAMELKGHQAAVWGVAIMPEGGYMLTASADKTIRLWKAGKCETTFTGHSDCVRDVVVITATDFLSCSNDSTIRRWSTVTRTCLRVFHGHNSFIYKLAALPNSEDFVSCGEDRTVRVWSAGAEKQKIVLPCQSVWAVCVLSNGDIVTGGSDATIRIFTCNQDRVASFEELQAYEEQLNSEAMPAQIGDIKTEDLVGPEALLVPGKRDGQTIMVRTETCIEAHQWSDNDNQWIKIGNVTGGLSENKTSSSGSKTHYQGKDYDFVFNVEIYEDKPPLKLPYNIGQDPWMAAHSFLENNNISQMFLDQVATFIQQQTAGITLGVETPPSVVSDPFTGGSRYVPGGAAPATAAPAKQDPFTGSSRYVPGGAEPNEKCRYFPETNYISFDQCNLQPMFAKLRDFNSSKAPGSQQISDVEIQSLEDLVSGKTRTTPELLELLWRLMHWPPEMLLPVLDLLRLVMRDPVANQLFCSTGNSSRLVGYACSVLNSPPSPSQNKNNLLIIRSLCNTFQHPNGEKVMLENSERLLLTAKKALGDSNDKMMQVAMSSFILNLSIGHGRQRSDSGSVQHCLLAAVDICGSLSDPEAQFRLLVAIGTIVCNGGDGLKALAKGLDVTPFLASCQSSSVDKLKVAAEQLRRTLC